MKKIFITTLLILAGFISVFASGHSVSIISSTNATCFGVCNGSATAVASGGIGPYSYAWTGPSGYTSANATATAMCAGIYTVTATDSSDMSIATVNVTISQPSQLNVSVTSSGTTCGYCNGSANAIASGGTWPYTYSWSNGSTAMIANGLCAATYTVTVVDSHGCTTTASTTIASSIGITAITSSTPTNCGICNGTASVDSVIGGSAPYYFSWSNIATTATVNNLCHGIYSVTITESSGCTVSYNVIVQELNTLNSTISSTPTTCNLCNGSASVIPAGGNPPYLFLWANAATDSSITGLCAGNYVVTITDNNSCSQTLMTNVNSVYSLSASFTNTPTTCNNSSDGAVNMTINGGTAPFTFVWSNGATTQNINGLAIGTYTVSITDSTNCVRIYNTSITSGSNLLGTITHTNTPCGSCTGTANISVTGGVGPYSYLWSGPSGFNSTLQSIVGLCVGNYYVTITDSNSCTKILLTGITSTNNMTATISNTQTNCNCNGTATLSVSGGSSPYTYLWNDPTHQTTQIATNLCAGNYNVTISDNNGCTITKYTQITQLPTTLNATITNTPTACNSCTGTATVFPTSGVPPYTYLWTTGAITQNVSSLCSGNYTVTITDSVNCKKYISTNVMSGNNLQLILDTIIHVSCSNNALGTISVHATGGTGIYNYNWLNGMTTPTITNLNPGAYTLHLYDSDSCSVFATYFVNNTYNLYTSVNSVNANCNNNGSASIYVSGLHPPFTFYWSDPLHQTTSTAINLAPGYYQATITDAIGCTRVVFTYINNTCLNVIKGVIYFDANQNCIQDSAEPGIPNIVVYSTGNYYGITNSNGQYVIYTPYMNNTVHPNNNFLNCYQSTCPNPAILYANFTNLGDTSYNNNFGYYALPSFFDLRLIPTYISQINPGFNKYYYLHAYNNSPTPQNALIRLIYDQNLIYVNSSNSGINNSSLYTVEWNIVNFPAWSYLNYYSYYANFYVPSSVPIGDTICALYEILPIIGDGCPNNNMWNICQFTTGSFDPNMKEVFPKGQGAQGFILQTDSVLNYTVHFQNTGNDTAFTVVVVDTLSQYLDPGTFVKGISSHPCTLTLTEQGIITFRFDNILLPDSNVNEPGSNGYVNYTVNLKPNLPIGTEIKNTASIFFDFNVPVITNTTLNTIASPLQIKEIKNKALVSAYPNPFKDFTTIKIKTDETNINYSFELIDIIGNNVMKIDNIRTKEFNIINSKLVEGIYFYIVKSNEKIIGSGKLIKN